MVMNQDRWKSIALPPIGCGLGGLDFVKQLRPLLIEYLPKIKTPIHLYLNGERRSYA